MRRRMHVPFGHAVLVACAALLTVLVLVEGWTWPLKVAAVMIPLAAILMG